MEIVQKEKCAAGCHMKKNKISHLACLIAGYIVTSGLSLILASIKVLIDFIFNSNNSFFTILIFMVVSYIVGLILYKMNAKN